MLVKNIFEEVDVITAGVCFSPMFLVLRTTVSVVIHKDAMGYIIYNGTEGR